MELRQRADGDLAQRRVGVELDDAVTVAIERRIDPSRTAEATSWMQAGTDLATGFAGFLGMFWVGVFAAGYPTGLKWNTVAKAEGSPKYVICNADEGDPGAFMDRAVLESDPHRVLEGMAIAAFAGTPVRIGGQDVRLQAGQVVTVEVPLNKLREDS